MSDLDSPLNNADLAAAEIRADTQDLPAFIEALAVRLEQALPGRVKVERHRLSLFSSDRRVERIGLTLNDEAFSLRARGTIIETSCAKTVRGIAIRNEVLPINIWLQRLWAAMSAEADTSAATYQALYQLLS